MWSVADTALELNTLYWNDIRLHTQRFKLFCGQCLENIWFLPDFRRRQARRALIYIDMDVCVRVYVYVCVCVCVCVCAYVYTKHTAHAYNTYISISEGGHRNLAALAQAHRQSYIHFATLYDKSFAEFF